MKFSKNNTLIRLVIAVFVLSLLLALPFIINNNYYLHLFIITGMNTILAMGFALLYGVGLITLGAAGFWAIGAYASALLVMNLAVPFWLALPIAGIIAGIVALFFGFILARYDGVGFVVLTLILALILQRVFGYIELFGGWGGISDISRPNSIPIPFLGEIEFLGKLPYYYLILFLLLLTIMVFYALYTSRVGRAWHAIKLNPQLAETLGINVYRYRLAGFVIASVFAGLAGSFYGHYNLNIQPDTFGILKSIYIQIYAILGGLEFYILGPVVGSLILTFAPEFFRPAQEFEPYFTGGLLILLVIFLPGGLMGLMKRILHISNIHRISEIVKAWVSNLWRY